MIQDADGEIVLDYTVVGTCERLDKKYLRLTSAPDPGSPSGRARSQIAAIRATCRLATSGGRSNTSTCGSR